MRIQYTCPPHLSFRLHMDNWNAMLNWSTESIEWLAANDEALDTLFIYPYAGTSCALIQYHTWARRRTPEALRMLEIVKETATRWEKAVQPGEYPGTEPVHPCLTRRSNVDSAQNVRDDDAAVRGGS